MIAPAGRRPVVVVTTISSDAHTWNLIFLQLLFEELGATVHNLGPCVPDAEIIAAAVRGGADLIAVSSVNGHGGAEGRRLIAAIRADLRVGMLPVIIGGKLDVSDAEPGALVEGLLAAGFDAVFADGHTPPGGHHLASHPVVRRITVGDEVLG